VADGWPLMRRLWSAPLGAHAAGLGLVLVALLPVVGTTSSFSADEGAAIIQARSLAGGGGWIVEHPFARADPAGVNYPLELSERGPAGSAPFGKHPLYALILAGVDRLGGVTGMVLLSVAGTVLAALLAASLARRIEPSLARPALWVVGLASPLLFDGYLVIAHTLGAALAAAAVLVAVVALERRNPIIALGVAPLVAGAVLLRREALFLGLAMGVVGAVLAVRRGEVRRAALVVAVTAPCVAAAAQVAERLWTRHLLGGGLEWSGVGAPSAGGSGLVAGRVRGFLLTWLTPAYGAESLAPIALLAMVTALAVGAVVLRRRGPAGGETVSRWSLVAAGAALLALLVGPPSVVPGLLVAFPLAAAGLLLVRRETLASLCAQVAFAVFALFAVGVVATQYAKGGAGEWGGRYFAIGLPVVVPVVLLALGNAGRALEGEARRRALASLVVCSLVLPAIGITALRQHHRNTWELVARFDRAGRVTGVDQPVLVSTQGAAPRYAWPTFERQRWLLAEPEGVGDLLDRVRAAGVTRVGFVTRNLERDEPLLGPAATVVWSDGATASRGWHVLVLQLA
jgi:hypothetical protein